MSEVEFPYMSLRYHLFRMMRRQLERGRVSTFRKPQVRATGMRLVHVQECVQTKVPHDQSPHSRCSTSFQQSHVPAVLVSLMRKNVASGSIDVVVASSTLPFQLPVALLLGGLFPAPVLIPAEDKQAGVGRCRRSRASAVQTRNRTRRKDD